MSRALYRIGAALIVLLDFGHSSGYPWSDPAWGVDLHAIQSSHFNVLGSSRTYWYFYVGFGLSVSVLLLLPAIHRLATWQRISPGSTTAHHRVGVSSLLRGNHSPGLHVLFHHTYHTVGRDHSLLDNGNTTFAVSDPDSEYTQCQTIVSERGESSGQPEALRTIWRRTLRRV